MKDTKRVWDRPEDIEKPTWKEDDIYMKRTCDLQ